MFYWCLMGNRGLLLAPPSSVLRKGLCSCPEYRKPWMHNALCRYHKSLSLPLPPHYILFCHLWNDFSQVAPSIRIQTLISQMAEDKVNPWFS